MADTEQDRAAMWSAYWALRVIANPPPFLVSARAQLWHHLDTTEAPEPPTVRHLSLVGGES